nr:hypothetical protein [Clostridia bacterium]
MSTSNVKRKSQERGNRQRRGTLGKKNKHYSLNNQHDATLGDMFDHRVVIPCGTKVKVVCIILIQPTGIVEEEIPILIDAQGNSMSVDCLTIKEITHLIWVVFRRYHK